MFTFSGATKVAGRLPSEQAAVTCSDLKPEARAAGDVVSGAGATAAHSPECCGLRSNNARVGALSPAAGSSRGAAPAARSALHAATADHAPRCTAMALMLRDAHARGSGRASVTSAAALWSGRRVRGAWRSEANQSAEWFEACAAAAATPESGGMHGAGAARAQPRRASRRARTSQQLVGKFDE